MRTWPGNYSMPCGATPGPLPSPGIGPATSASGDQFAADRIASYFREHGNEKVLVFVRRERLGLGQGVPYLVAQETKARQLIVNPRKPSAAGARLLAGN